MLINNVDYDIVGSLKTQAALNYLFMPTLVVLVYALFGETLAGGVVVAYALACLIVGGFKPVRDHHAAFHRIALAAGLTLVALALDSALMAGGLVSICLQNLIKAVRHG